MKKIPAGLIILLLFSSCVPSQKALQEAVAQTLTAMPPTAVKEFTSTSQPPQPTAPLPKITFTPIPTVMAKSCTDASGVELLSQPWHLEGDNSSSEAEQKVDPNVLKGKTTLLITYDLHGLEIHEGERKDESAIIFDQPHWYVISLANYGQSGLDGIQTVEVPLSDFIGLPDAASGTVGGAPLNLNQPVNALHTRFWSSKQFVIDITSVCAFTE